MMKRALFPLVSVWLVAGYIHLIQYLCLNQVFTISFLYYLLFLPVVGFEIWATRWFKTPDRKPAAPTLTSVLPYIGNLLFWIVFFLFWVKVVVYFAFQGNPAIIFMATYIHLHIMLLWRSMTYWAFFPFLFWLLVYVLVTVRLRRLRIFTSLVVPGVITGAMFFHQFYLGGIGNVRPDEIENQAGVHKVLDAELLRQRIENREMSACHVLNHGRIDPCTSWIPLRNHPRSIVVDSMDRAVIVSYGCTYCWGGNGASPVLIRRETETGNVQAVLSRFNVRGIFGTESSLFIAPWTDQYIYEISRRDLSVIHTMPHQSENRLRYWEPMGLLKDVSEDRLYVANNAHPAILAYDLSSGKLTRVLDLFEEGLVGFGGGAWCLIQSASTRRIYFNAFPHGRDVFEVDPDTLRVIRSLDLGDNGGSALVLDDENETLYYQSGFYDNLYRIDLETFEKTRTYHGKYHSRRMCLDQERRVLYILGYNSGDVSALDLSTGRQVWSIRVGGRAHGMTFDRELDRLWTHSMAGVYQIDLKTVWSVHGGSENPKNLN